jgi:hypothetical protein
MHKTILQKNALLRYRTFSENGNNYMYLTQVITFNTDNIIVTYLLKINVTKHFSEESSYAFFFIAITNLLIILFSLM